MLLGRQGAAGQGAAGQGMEGRQEGTTLAYLNEIGNFLVPRESGTLHYHRVGITSLDFIRTTY